MPEPVVYQTGHIKHDPESKAVAVRTQFPVEDFPDMEWLVATVGSGASNRPGSYVSEWVDLFTPEPSA